MNVGFAKNIAMFLGVFSSIVGFDEEGVSSRGGGQKSLKGEKPSSSSSSFVNVK